jgi:ATP-binding cassette subfamily B (MDR/TAP) protein 1
VSFSRDEAASARSAPDAEKPLGSLLPAAIDMPEKARSRDLSLDDVDSSERVNQGIAEKLYICIQGLLHCFSPCIVALAVEWKLALIMMSIVPAMVYPD